MRSFPQIYSSSRVKVGCIVSFDVVAIVEVSDSVLVLVVDGDDDGDDIEDFGILGFFFFVSLSISLSMSLARFARSAFLKTGSALKANLSCFA